MTSKAVTTHVYTFLLLPGFSSLALASAVEPLRVANYIADAPLYDWRIVSADGGPVSDGAGVATAVDGPLDAVAGCDTLLVCGGSEPFGTTDGASREHLRALAEAGVRVGGIMGGLWPLAEAGLLHGQDCAVRWSQLQAFRSAFPTIRANDRLFVIDAARISCVGGTAVVDMMLHLIAERRDWRFVAEVSTMLVRDGVHGHFDRQRIPRRRLQREAQAVVADVVAIMEANLQEPLGVNELAGYAGMSQRKLSRLFQCHVGCTPARFYLALRLMKARELLRESSLSVAAVAHACGFTSISHFSTRYRAHFGMSPSEGRRGPRITNRHCQYRVATAANPVTPPAPA